MVRGLLEAHNVPTNLRGRVAARMAQMSNGRFVLPKENRIFFNCTMKGFSETAISIQESLSRRLKAKLSKEGKKESRIYDEPFMGTTANWLNDHRAILAAHEQVGRMLYSLRKIEAQTVAAGRDNPISLSSFSIDFPQFSKLQNNPSSLGEVNTGLPYKVDVPSFILNNIKA